MVNDLKHFEGSVKNIARIPDDLKKFIQQHSKLSHVGLLMQQAGDKNGLIKHNH